MFGLFKKKVKEIEIRHHNYESVAVDMHSHVLPGIDDGAQTPEDSLKLISTMMDMGIRKIVATPHIMSDYYKNNAETINGALTVLKKALADANMNIEIEAAAEHYYDEHFQELIEQDKLMLIKNKYVLFELSFASKPFQVVETIKKLTAKGLTPILAHPERYPYLTIAEASEFKFWGCFLQLNTISLSGYYGRQAKESAEALLENNLISFISSDMHHERHAQAFRTTIQQPALQNLLDQRSLMNSLLL